MTVANDYRMREAELSTDINPLAIHSKRAKPRFFLLDDHSQLSVCEPEALELLECRNLAARYNGIRRLLEPLAATLATVVSAMKGDGEAMFGPLRHLIFRVRRLAGADGSHVVAVFIEVASNREELHAATERYSLAPRDVQVLRLMLAGKDGHEIAEALQITEGTVNDYFKMLLRKTDAKNRSEMLAKIFSYRFGNADEAHASTP